MSLIKSISGIRGTIGGSPGESLSPVDLVMFVSAYAGWLKLQSSPKDKKRYRVVVGRDARISGPVIEPIVSNTLLSLGVDVVLADLATTPTVEMAVVKADADGGIILTASHNPENWNALKLLNNKGEFLSAKDGKTLLDIAEKADFQYAEVDQLGVIVEKDFLSEHIQAILDLRIILTDKIRKKNYKVVVDAVNSVGGIAIPALLEALGVRDVILINGQPDGHFAHNPEPLPEHLEEICKVVKDQQADLGIVVDPDVDRLALVNHDGSLFGEEYTLVAASDYVLSLTSGNTVSNLSSTRALRDITEKHGGKYFSSAVGEVNVVEAMKSNHAVIGGEGNGGVILPELHYGRDALVGIALILSLLAERDVSLKQLRMSYPDYGMSKNKIELGDGIDPDLLLKQIASKYSSEKITTIDGVKIDFEDSWVHLRKSNTEPIIRIYTEAPGAEAAEVLARRFISELKGV